MINFCNECGEPFETDQEWKKTCTKCWLRWKHPEIYKMRYEMDEKICKKCKKPFVDDAWKDLCHPCWVADQEEKKQEDLEEREQFK